MTTQQRTQIVFLGTGTPNADPERFGSCVAIVVDDKPYLVDFGPGVVRRAAAAHQQGVKGLAVENLNRAFLTHLHSDHTAGYPDLIFTPWVLGRNVPLEVYGPSGLSAMTTHILAAYEQDIHERLHGLEPANERGYQVITHEIQSGLVFEDDYVTVEAFPVKHGSWQAFGYRFSTPDRIIVLSGDTAPTPDLPHYYADCDVLIHEVYSVKGFAHKTPAWQRYHSSVHTSTHELAHLANEVQPELLLLYHQLLWGVTEDELVNELRSIYSGEVISAKDLDIF